MTNLKRRLNLLPESENALQKTAFADIIYGHNLSISTENKYIFVRDILWIRGTIVLNNCPRIGGNVKFKYTMRVI